MASKDYQDPAAQATAQSEQTATAQSGADTSELLATLSRVFSTFQKQLQNQPQKEFGANALAAASVFNDIAAALQLKFPPVRPNLVKAEAVSPTEVKLEWTYDDNSNNTAGFRVYRCQGKGCNTFNAIEPPLPSSARTYQDGNLSSGTTYRYKVSPFNVRGEMESNIVDVTTPGGHP